MHLDLATAIQLTPEAMAAAPLIGHDAVAKRFLEGIGGSAVDVGCGEGRFTVVMAKFFDTMSGIDVRADRIAGAEAAARTSGLKADFRVGSAEKMPYADGSFDAVIFSNSLHHIPDCDRALIEAARIMKDDGLVYVMEPVAAGTYFQATRMVDDETLVRRDAYKAMQRADGLHPQEEFLYRSRTIYESFDVWKEHQIHLDPKRSKPFEANEAEMRRTFEGVAEPENGKLAFNQFYRVNTFTKA